MRYLLLVVMVYCGCDSKDSSLVQTQLPGPRGVLRMELGFADAPGAGARKIVPPEIESVVVRIVARDGNEVASTVRIEGAELAHSSLRVEDLRLPVAVDYMVRVESFDRSKKKTRDFERLVRLESGPNDLKLDLLPTEGHRSAVFFQVPYILLSDQVWQSFGPLRESLNSDGFLHQEGRLYFPPVPCRFWTLELAGKALQTDATGRVRVSIEALRASKDLTLRDPTGALQASVPRDSFGKGRTCEKAFVLPFLFQPASDSALKVDENQPAGPNLQNTIVDKRGTYPADFDGECRGSNQQYLNSPCFQRRVSGECSIEDLKIDYAALASFPNGIPIDFLGWSQSNFFSAPRFLNLTPAVIKADKTSCRAYHLGRDCTQTTPGDISLEVFSQIWLPDESFPVVEVGAGETVQLVLHNNGSSGVTYLQAESSGIGGSLSFRYAEEIESRSLFFSANSTPIAIKHGVRTAQRFEYFPDLFLSYKAPQTATPGSEDYLVFWADHRRVPVKVRVRA